MDHPRSAWQLNSQPAKMDRVSPELMLNRSLYQFLDIYPVQLNYLTQSRIRNYTY